MFACLSVCLYVRIFRKPHGQILSNFLCMLTVAVARPSSGSDEIYYVLPVLWMTPCFHAVRIMGAMARTVYCVSGERMA